MNAVREIDEALNIARQLVYIEVREEKKDIDVDLYEQMRKHLATAYASLLAIDSTESREASMAIDWTLAHLFPYEEVNVSVRCQRSSRALDPRLHPFASIYGRAQWLHETQRERLVKAKDNLILANRIYT